MEECVASTSQHVNNDILLVFNNENDSQNECKKKA